MTTVHLKNTRLAFAQLFEAKRVNDEGEPAFSCAFLFEPGHPAEALMEAAIEEVAKAKWGEKAAAMLKSIRAQDKTAIHDGDNKATYEGYAGNLFVNARSKTRPTLVDRDRSPLTQADGRPYSGCYVNGIVELWAQENKFGKRINASLKGVQFLKDGDAFSGGSVANAEDFDNLGVDGDDTDDLAS